MSHRFTLLETVTEEHLDNLNHVNNVQYLLWAQQIAKAHWEKLKNILEETTGVWMVRNHQVNYRLGAFLGDNIRIETHIKEVRGPLSIRVVKFFNDKTDRLLVSCQTQWCYVDLTSRKPIKVPAEIEKFFLMDSSPI